MSQAPADKKSGDLGHADIEWQSGQPYSRLYDDVYFSSDSGLAESRHVFLQHNRLAQRWLSLLPSQQTQARETAAPVFTTPVFTIAETGFGTGLNFLCAWQLWQTIVLAENRHALPRLHFISTESHPLSLVDMQSALALWPELASFSAALLQQYRMLAPGWHRLQFAQGHVVLTLLVGDILHTLPQLQATVDAWFLDGFSPAKNPAMWQPALFMQMARLSHVDTSFATFTSAGAVRRGLQQAGFQVSKVAGYGRKREMACGVYVAHAAQLGCAAPAKITPAGFTPGVMRSASAKTSDAIVIGGGIAGCASSHALARRGMRVQLLERHTTLAQEASGNPVGVLYPRLSAGDAVLGQLAMAGFLHSLRLIDSMGLAPPMAAGSGAPPGQHYQACGVLQLGYNAKELARCQAIAAQHLPGDVVRYVDSQQASELAGLHLDHGGLYFAAAGWLNPSAFCQALATHSLIQAMPQRHAWQLKQVGDGWQVWDQQGLIAAAPVVIIAGAHASLQFAQAAHCQLQAVRGQITLLAPTAASAQLKTVLCTEGYITPASGGLHCLGATFQPDDLSTDVRLEDHLANLHMVQAMLPGLLAASADNIDISTLQGRAALRCATRDYLPMVGPLLDAALVKAQAPRHTDAPASLPWLPGVYLNTGHGSKGLVTAPLCGEILASAICGEPAPVPSNILAALDPNRLLLRSMGLKSLAVGLAAFPGR